MRVYACWQPIPETRISDETIERFVFKQLAKRQTWEARIDGTSIAAETRRDAIDAARAAHPARS